MDITSKELIEMIPTVQKKHVRKLAQVINSRIDFELSHDTELTVEVHDGNGGKCFCGKEDLKQSTILIFNKPVTLFDFRGQGHTQTKFNVGNDCIQDLMCLVLKAHHQKKLRML